MSHDRLCDRANDMMNDVARTVSINIQNDLARHPEDALTILNAINGNQGLPPEFTSSSQLFGNGFSDGMMRDVAQTVSQDIQRDLAQHPEDALTLLNALQGNDRYPINPPQSNGPYLGDSRNDTAWNPFEQLTNYRDNALPPWSNYNGNGRTDSPDGSRDPLDMIFRPPFMPHFPSIRDFPMPPDLLNPRDLERIGNIDFPSLTDFPLPLTRSGFSDPFESIANTASDIVHHILPEPPKPEPKKDDGDGHGVLDTIGSVAKTVLPFLSFL